MARALVSAVTPPWNHKRLLVQTKRTNTGITTQRTGEVPNFGYYYNNFILQVNIYFAYPDF